MKGGDSNMVNKYNDYGTGIPRHEIEALAKVFLPDMQAFFETEEGRQEYAEWQVNQAKENNHNK